MEKHHTNTPPYYTSLKSLQEKKNRRKKRIKEILQHTLDPRVIASIVAVGDQANIKHVKNTNRSSLYNNRQVNKAFSDVSDTSNSIQIIPVSTWNIIKDLSGEIETTPLRVGKKQSKKYALLSALDKYQPHKNNLTALPVILLLMPDILKKIHTIHEIAEIPYTPPDKTWQLDNLVTKYFQQYQPLTERDTASSDSIDTLQYIKEALPPELTQSWPICHNPAGIVHILLSKGPKSFNYINKKLQQLELTNVIPPHITAEQLTTKENSLLKIEDGKVLPAAGHQHLWKILATNVFGTLNRYTK